MPTPRERAELTVLRVLDEHQRSGGLPAPVLRRIQSAAWRNGRVLTEAQVAVQCREWVERMLAAHDVGGDPNKVE